MADYHKIADIMERHRFYMPITKIALLLRLNDIYMSETAISARLRDKFHHYPRRRVEGKRYYEYKYKAKPKGEI